MRAELDDAPGGTPFARVMDELCAADHALARGRLGAGVRGALPCREAIGAMVEDLRAVLFPGHFGCTDLSPAGLRHHVGTRLHRAWLALSEQTRRSFSFGCEHGGAACACHDRAVSVADAAIARLPAVRALLETDVQAAYDGDPAARFVDETLLCYPGVTAIIQHRLAHELHRLSVPLLPRMIAELAHSATGIDIHPGAQIGASFFIDHGTGVVIGETCIIGDRVRLYQGVTLGARGFPGDESGRLIKGLPRHPIVEDDVVVYAGATILGRITIGRGATIGGNVWLTRSVVPGSRVTQAQCSSDRFEAGSGI
jgi:serine O-acetyltransferase